MLLNKQRILPILRFKLYFLPVSRRMIKQRRSCHRFSHVHTGVFKPYADHEVKTVTKELKPHKFMTGYGKTGPNGGQAESQNTTNSNYLCTKVHNYDIV